jgi:hypothetical protein
MWRQTFYIALMARAPKPVRICDCSCGFALGLVRALI